jgi:hypothetical protein
VKAKQALSVHYQLHITGIINLLALKQRSHSKWLLLSVTTAITGSAPGARDAD